MQPVTTAVTRVTQRILLTSMTCFLLSASNHAFAQAETTTAPFQRTTLLNSDNQRVTLSFDAREADNPWSSGEEASDLALAIPGEGQVLEYGKPILPLISRFVVVPPDAGIEFSFTADEPRQIAISGEPELCLDESIEAPVQTSSSAFFPPVIAEVSEPLIIRGVRLVKVTTYPILYNQSTNSYVRYDHITTELKFNGNQPVNPVVTPFRRNRSGEFLRFIKALAINGEDVGRDDANSDAELAGHYLVVTNENCLQYVAPFIEWRRKAGYQVDILSLPDEVASNDTTEIKAQIQARYNDYLNQGIDPFDQLLLVGDRSSYREPPAAGWVLAAPQGESTWPQGANHADYKYACLEGVDSFPDVGFARFCAGTDSILDLFTGRTLSYEATPYVEDTRWFTRGAVYSSHWGNTAVSAWHVSIHTNLRWAEQLLKYKGFQDIRFYEDFEHNLYGDRAAGFERTQFDDGTNLMLGRTETLYWADTVQNELAENQVFPLRITFSGHGEFPTWRLLRVGSGARMKGPVAATCGWGSPSTTGSNAIWLETTNALINRDLSYGWSRSLAITIAEQYFSNYWNAAQRVYGAIKTDNDFYGDPGLKPWLGVPRVVRASFPASIDPSTRSIDVTVMDEEGQSAIPDAQVVLYAPGEMPAYDHDDYADYDGMEKWTARSDGHGKALFHLGSEPELVSGTTLYVTVVGRDIRPFLGSIAIQEQDSAVEVVATRVMEIQGNGNGIANPGERLSLRLTAQNFGASELNNVSAIVTSLSPYISIAGGNQIQFGDIQSNEQAYAQNEFEVGIAQTCPDAAAIPEQSPKFQVEFTSGDFHWKSIVNLNPSAPRMAIRSINDGNVVQLGQDRQLDIVAENAGRQAISPFTIRLYSLGSGVIVRNNSTTFRAIDPGAYDRCNSAPLTVTGSPSAIPGSKCPMMATFIAQDGFVDRVYFDLQVGARQANAPQGPDAYGYICYDNSDQNWRNAPDYDWIEISPVDQEAVYEGVELQFNRQTQFDVGDAKVIPLPFRSKFYGVWFDSVTVGSNGYVLPGNQARIINPQNWPLDRGIGGGVGMIAPFWDWLRFQANSNIYYYADVENGRLIIEWYRMRHYYADQNDLTFQVILYDQSRWARESGDSDVLFQYKQIDNISGGAVGDSAEYSDIFYASVGLSSPTGTTGLSYTFRNNYPVTSAALANRSAILYTTSPLNHEGVAYGRVLEAGTNQPVAEALVFTTYGLTCRTDQDGFYRLPNIVNGRFSLTAWGEGFADSTRTDIDLSNDVSVEINFTLEHGSDAPSEVGDLPKAFTIESVSPNPFNGTTTIHFSLDKPSYIRLSAFDLRGREVATIFSGMARPGIQHLEWDANTLPTGLYLLRMESADDRIRTSKALLAR